MLEYSLVFILASVMSLGWGYFAFCFFREKKTGVKSKFLPDRKTLKDSKKSTGISTLMGLLGFVLCLAFCKENLPLTLSCVAFLTALTLVGFADDFLTDIKGSSVGIRKITKFVAIILSALTFSSLVILTKTNTVITLPFVRGGVRLEWAYPLFLLAITLVFTKGFENLGDAKGGEYPMTFVALSGVLAVSNLKNGFGQTGFVAIFLGLVVGAVWWTYPPGFVKTGLGDKYFCSGVIISACVLTSNENFLCVISFLEIISILAKPVDKLVYKAFSKHVFLKLPICENLKAMKFSDKKIYVTCIILNSIFCLIGVTENLATYYLN